MNQIGCKLSCPLPVRRITNIAALLLLSIWLSTPSLSAAETNQNCIIPNLQAWKEVTNGLPVTELEKLLGQPIKKVDPLGAYEPNTIYHWTYGYVAKQSEIFPEDFAFVVLIETGKVWGKEDPFGGVAISKDGSPTVPKLMSPSDSTVFHHYPRLVDFRWYASSGDYPMTYEIEINVKYTSGKWSPDEEPRKVSVPYYSYSHSGASRGRWRVRGLNAKGYGKWSDYFYFNFKT